MSLSHINPQQLAELWARRVTGRMTLMGIGEEEIQETSDILKSFIKTGVELLIQDPKIEIPQESVAQARPAQNSAHLSEAIEMFEQPEAVILDADKLNKLIELFIRSVNQMSKQLRDQDFPWDTRKYLLEQAAWETFNMSKILIGLYYTPNSKIRALDTTDLLLQEMVKQGTDDVLNRFLKAYQNASAVPEGG